MASQPEPARSKPLRTVRIHPDHQSIDLAPFAEEYKVALRRLGVFSIEQFVSVSQVEPRLMSEYLGVNVENLIHKVPAPEYAVAALPMEVLTAEYSFGVPLEQPVRGVLPPIDPAALEQTAAVSLLGGGGADVNHIPDMQPIRNQGERGTCVAHAVVATFEHFTRVTSSGDFTDLSEQWLYWLAKEHDGKPQDKGTFIRVAMPLLFTDGCCLETTWPYQPNQINGNEGQSPPPPGAAPDAAKRKIGGFNTLLPRSVPAICAELNRNRCVAVSVPVFNMAFLSPETRKTGDVIMPLPNDYSVGGHAICLVGYESLPSETGISGGRFLVRNSWDSLWGVYCPYGAGYGTIPYAYLTTYGMEAYSIQ
jgi:hypothetical protein